MKKVSKEESEKDFWVRMGKDIGETKACGASLSDAFHKFVTNDHVHLCNKVDALDEKVDKLTIKLAAAIGAATAVVQVALKFLVK